LSMPHCALRRPTPHSVRREDDKCCKWYLYTGRPEQTNDSLSSIVSCTGYNGMLCFVLIKSAMLEMIRYVPTGHRVMSCCCCCCWYYCCFSFMVKREKVKHEIMM
jgi:hypothetical protein